MSKIIHGDCLEVMRKAPDNCIDSIITDPPYGLKFMGKKWDYNVPSIEHFQEMLRVIKPGGYLLCFGGSRTFHRMAVNIEDAGWEIRDTIMWLYGSGFPKSYNISKGIDKAAGAEREVIKQEDTRSRYDSCNRNSTGESSKNVSFGVDYGKVNITAPATPEAKTWDGYGTALKPAFEPIIVAMKPIEGNYVNNALTHGVAGLNIDGSRIEGRERTEYGLKNSKRNNKAVYSNDGKSADFDASKGRFPANIILDEEAGEMLDEQSGITKSTGGKKGNSNSFNLGESSGDRSKSSHVGGLGDVGGASRFFYCAKASKSERNAGCEGLEEKFAPTMGKGIGVKEHDPETATKKQNNHPCVKPLKLMEYLCNLTRTPTGGIVLDPYAGSGTTGPACINTDREYILIEMDKEYIEIIKKRVEYYTKNQHEERLSHE